MTKLELDVKGGQVAFEPASVLAGEVRWEQDKPLKWLRVRALWYTEGKGDLDSATVEEVEFESCTPFGSESFKFQLPEGPYSFSGKHISLLWAIEAEAKPGGVERLDFIMAPGGEEIELGEPEEPDPKEKKKAIRFGRS